MSEDAESRVFSLDAELLRTLIDKLPVMVFMKDAIELRFEFINRAGENLLGRSREELIGRTDRELFAPLVAAAFEARDRGTLAPSRTIEVTEEPISTSAGVRWLRTTKMSIGDESGGGRHLLAISEDITADRELARALVRAEGALRDVQRRDAMGQLAAGIVHDFDNQLSVILGKAEAAMAGLTAGDPLRIDLAEVARAGRQCADLTRRLLALACGGAAAPRIVDLNDVIFGMERMLRRLVGENIQLSTDLTQKLWTVSADPSALEQVLVSLVLNARDAMPGGGALVIKTTNVELDEAFMQRHPDAMRGPHVLLAVSDTGHGIDQETMARVSEPFFTTKAPQMGTGLGLWSVRDIVRRRGGTVLLTSELGTGTTVKVYVPRADGRPTPPNAGVPPEFLPALGDETILLVEEEELLLRVVCGVLRRHGYTVLGARGPGEALLLSEQHAGTIDLLVTDVVMPLLSGPQLAERLLCTRPAMKVVFTSGYTPDAIERHGLPGSRFVLVQKPFSTSTLTRKIREALEFVGS